MWFEELVGFKEENPEQVRSNLKLENGNLISKINNKSYRYGTLEIPTLNELRGVIPDFINLTGRIEISEQVAGIQDLHIQKNNEGAVFQVASQFNLLEMVGPHVTPERGIGIYENDYTQGPSCAIAFGAGTIYRNYFVELENQIGQSSKLQIDCLEEIGKYFDNRDSRLWKMQNGYVLANKEGLQSITNKINSLNESDYEKLKGLLKVGIQENTEVTISSDKLKVTQVFCSALPVAYSDAGAIYWEQFARLILRATYEATFFTALLNFLKTGNRLLYLTLVGGGAFGNEKEWILDAIEKSIHNFRNTPLHVKIVSYKYSDPMVNNFIRKLNLTN